MNVWRSSDRDGVLTVGSMLGLAGQPLRWREVGPFQYRQIGGWRRLAATVRDGRPVFLQADDFPPVEGLQPVPPWLSASWNLPLFFAILAILAIAVVAWPLGAIARRRYRAPPGRSGRTALLHHATRAGCAVQLAFWIGWFLLLQIAGGDIDSASPTSDGWICVLEVIGWIGALGAVAAVWNAVTVQREPNWRLWGRVAPVLIALACAGTVWFGFGLDLLDGRLVY